uniref:Uncharacterized protein n=1 Tax=Setaria viridis TaxID=4556 RepID=A0A4U6STT7_SETVI|nr:hypothetical protein SEVIR_9G138450v2 [Setaria viridis]
MATGGHSSRRWTYDSWLFFPVAQVPGERRADPAVREEDGGHVPGPGDVGVRLHLGRLRLGHRRRPLPAPTTATSRSCRGSPTSRSAGAPRTHRPTDADPCRRRRRGRRSARSRRPPCGGRSGTPWCTTTASTRPGTTRSTPSAETTALRVVAIYDCNSQSKPNA